MTQVIRAQRPPASCEAFECWPAPRKTYEQGYGHREAEELFGEDPRLWATDTIGFVGDDAVEAVRIQDFSYEGGRHLLEGTEHDIPAQLVLIAKGFLGAQDSLFDAFGVEQPLREDQVHLLRAGADRTAPVFIAGDVRMGSTLVATAIADALVCADEVCAALA